MLGLLRPSSGDILIDGMPLRQFGIRAFRDQVGVVMQDDQLMSGSVADNICCFDEAFDVEWMQTCARRRESMTRSCVCRWATTA